MGDAIGNAFTGISDSIIDAILNRFIQWLFKSIYDGIANFFTQISNMGTEIFEKIWNGYKLLLNCSLYSVGAYL